MVIFLLALVFITVNLIFGTAHMFCGSGALGNNDNPSFLDDFFFSVQTFATIGYGYLYPKSHCSNWIMTLEAFTQLVGTALITGFVFAKFSIPQSKVLFSKHLLITKHNGKPVLRFRMANARGNQIVEARINVTLLVNETNSEGEFVRRLIDLVPDRHTSPAFAFSWLVTHEINETSPLYGLNASDFKTLDTQIIVSLVGIDNTSAQTVHARHLYLESAFVWNHKFVDVIGKESDGRRFIDLSKFHHIVSHGE